VSLPFAIRVTRKCISSPRSFSNATSEPSRRCSGGTLRMSSVKVNSGLCSPNPSAGVNTDFDAFAHRLSLERLFDLLEQRTVDAVNVTRPASRIARTAQPRWSWIT
jgi:hypothetical protein